MRDVDYVARRLDQAGWLVATEVEVGDARWRGFVDLLAFHPVERLLLIIEVKIELDDISAPSTGSSAATSDSPGQPPTHSVGDRAPSPMLSCCWRPTTTIAD